ncbi:MAG TPA: phosphoribosylformylglycinamidine cyclo-ligase [Acidimicrobiales bacterium]|nr:phosphoribosylformylglycinamidine cyclo-ligase [Acidimicrobiales bacterium]
MPTAPAGAGGATYAGAGVDIAAGDAAVDRIKGLVASTTRPGVLGGIGGFGGLFALDTDRYRRPVLVSATDGVGTKLLVARATGRYGTVGIDLVAMCVDDLVCSGAEPLFFLDYVAVGRLVPDRIEEVVAGVADGCRQAGCALIGGETAEHPGHFAAGDFDLAGAATGVVEAGELLGPERVRPGDVLVALGSSGLHSNGFSLVRRILDDPASGLDLAAVPPGLDRPLGDELLEPTRIYARDCLALAAGTEVRTFAHITGGGLAANLARVLPAAADATLDRSTWTPAPVFGLLGRAGGVPATELERVFNQGIGMIAIVAGQDADRAVALLTDRGVPAWAAGMVTPGTGQASLAGTHPA